MTVDSEQRLLALTTPLGEDVLLVDHVAGEERVSGLYSFTLDVVSETEDLDFSKVVGKTATLRIKLPDDSNRYWHGHIGRFAQVGSEDARYRYRAELLPWLWFLQHTADSRIFQDLSVPDILEKVFKGRGFNDFRKSLSKTYNPRTYCVQYRESDFDFVSRLMEEEGIFYYFEHAEDKHTLVLADASSAIAACPVKSSIPYRPKAGANEGDDIFSWLQSQTVVPGKVSLRDYNFETPSTDLTASSPTVAKVAKQDSLELYDYPGNYLQASGGENYAQVRMQEWEARQVRIDGGGDCRTLAPGYSFTLKEHFRTDYDGDYLLLSVRHDISNNLPWKDGDGHYENRFVCQPKATVYRPPRITPQPVVHGAQTAVVVGPAGEEIYTDKYGRIKVQFPWDRLGKNDDKSSCWVRVSQGWAGLNWGAMHIPRVGQEVIVDFLEGSPDQPIVTGRVYNGEKMPPYELPTNKTQSGIKSRSSASGTAENFNELRFEDKKGSEDVYFQAEKDFHRLVKNDDDLQVQHDQTITIKNNRTETIQEGNDTLTVEKGNHTAEIKEGNASYTVTKGTRTVTVEGNDTHEIKTGNRTVSVDTGNDALTVKKGNRTVEVSVGNDELTIKAGNQVTKIDAGKAEMEAMQSIELKVGGSSIKIEPSGITISSAKVTVDGSGGVTVAASAGDVSASGLNVSLTGQIGATLKGNATAELSASGQTTVKGGIVMIN
ncbi:type VI secretion system secreted protein VgrG [Andreprevotia lacus DSM 23236]|jgi:type VI secretion system secreted protein VgrG|uniref:Type VI secretion system secreted protein VgrG n=1 Tax=Andreprevotia lacus DSM 23236 TaxID=1121001 RepID=A0A1W1XGC9_9NEIS|nr:type VI secretion system tip protein VgrG [Andreprevotia lacus]SMC22844.1 type VI secretion system secreted protein VgrG [Andreprevotia lacus DSM 23236]